MTWRVLQEWRDKYDEIVVLFANTGLEHEKTLEFVRNCDRVFGFNTVWLEAVVNELGKGNTHRVVTFETASRNGEPFEAHIKKNGIPNVGNPKCSDRLKAQVMRSYVRNTLGHKRRDYSQCVGIRADEIDRMSEQAMSEGVIYPMVGWGITQTMVLDWWSQQEFDLDLPQYLGNCITCFKKSDRKLYTIARENPDAFSFAKRMEENHSTSGPFYKRTGIPSRWFRNNRVVADIIAASQEPSFIPWTPGDDLKQQGLFSLDEMDISNGCTESCEVDYI
jgi:hypothetical protein